MQIRRLVFVALVVLAGCGTAQTQSVQEPLRRSTEPVETSAPSAAMETPPELLTASETAVRVTTTTIALADPWDEYNGRYSCRFARAGHVTPCCAQWWQLGLDVGFPPEAMPVLDYIMGRESGCNPGAYNSQTCGGGHHAIGLTQLCGWGGSELYDPWTNLSKALTLYHARGWRDWRLGGDAVTG